MQAKTFKSPIRITGLRLRVCLCLPVAFVSIFAISCRRLKSSPPPPGLVAQEGERLDYIRAEKQWVRQEANGKFTRFFLNGVPSIRGFKNAQGRYGDWVFYSRDGKKITSRGKFTNNIKDGVWEYFDEEGRLYMRVRYKLAPLNKNLFYMNHNFGSENGPYERYYPDGSLEEKGNFLAGEFDGPLVRYTPRGRISEKGQFKANKRVGLWQYYYPEGKLEREESFKKGKLHGELINYRPDGEVYQRALYVEGKLVSTSLFKRSNQGSAEKK